MGTSPFEKRLEALEQLSPSDNQINVGSASTLAPLLAKALAARGGAADPVADAPGGVLVPPIAGPGPYTKQLPRDPTRPFGGRYGLTSLPRSEPEEPWWRGRSDPPTEPEIL